MKLFKKLCLSLCLIFALSLLTVHFSASAAQLTAAPAGYTAIYTFEDLYAVRNDLSGKYILMNDIDMSEETKAGGDWDVNGNGWLPIGDAYYNCFEGVFDGNGYSIKGMNIHGTVDYTHIGLFGYTSYAEITDLKVEDVNISIVKTEGNAYIGAIVGTAMTTDISGSFSSGEIYCNASSNTAYHYTTIGGVVGLGSNSLANCYSIADITYTDNSDATGYIGGVAGRIENEIINCYFAGSLSGTGGNQSVGAVAGSCQYNGFGSCYYLNGSYEGQTSTTNCQALSKGQMQFSTAFTGWDFSKVWVIDPTGSYKYPQLREAMQVPVTSIKMIFSPDKTVYTQGDAINPAGAYIEVSHKDGSKGQIAVSKAMLSGYNSQKLGLQKIKVTYIGATTTFNVKVKPAKVSNLKQASKSTASVKLSWSKISGANGYMVYRLSGGEWVKLKDTTAASYTATGLKAGTGYTYGIRAYVTVNGKKLEGTLTKITAYTGLAKVSGVKTTPKISKATVKWSKLSGADGYIIYKNSGGKWTKVDSTTSTSMALSGLKPATSHLMAVVGYSKEDGKIIAQSEKTVFKIKTKAALKAKSYKLSATSYTYSGSKKTPAVTVKGAGNKKLTQNTDYTVTYQSGRKNVGKYKVTVTMKGDYTGKKVLYFSINPKAVSVKSVASDSNNLKIKWSKAKSQTTGYQIQYSTSKSFSSKYTSTATVKSSSTTSLTVDGLKNSTKYYVRIRSYKKVSGKNYYSDWSSVKTYVTKKFTYTLPVEAKYIGYDVEVIFGYTPSFAGYYNGGVYYYSPFSDCVLVFEVTDYDYYGDPVIGGLAMVMCDMETLLPGKSSYSYSQLKSILGSKLGSCYTSELDGDIECVLNAGKYEIVFSGYSKNKFVAAEIFKK